MHIPPAGRNDMPLNSEWWQKVAGMTRKELLDALVREAEAHLGLQAALSKVNDAEKLRESVIVAATRTEAEISMARLGLKPYSNNRTFVLTASYLGNAGLRGRNLKTDHVLLVPGWARGKHADEVKRDLTICGVNWANCRYAPSPETDRAEGLSNWGRTEAAIVDDTIKTLSELMTRSLERTAE